MSVIRLTDSPRVSLTARLGQLFRLGMVCEES